MTEARLSYKCDPTRIAVQDVNSGVQIATLPAAESDTQATFSAAPRPRRLAEADQRFSTRLAATVVTKRDPDA